jgi:hypothetical protein
MPVITVTLPSVSIRAVELPHPSTPGWEHRGGSDAADFDVRGEADPDQASILARLGLIGAQLGVVDNLQRLVERSPR